MKPRDYLWLGGLLIGATFIWLRDLAWLPFASDTLPILGALPLFVWLGAPWRFQSTRPQLHGVSLAAAGLLLVAGILADFTLLLAAAWSLALWSWLRGRVSEAVNLRRLILLPFMAFPWMTLDMAPVGWWFRVSAAWTTEHLFSVLGFAVVRQGTNLLVHGLPIEVAPACSGMNSLQAVLIAGIVLALHEFPYRRLYWLSLATLPVLAWGANVLRVCSVVAVALTWGSELAHGWCHDAAGWLILMAIFFCWWLAIRAGWRWSKTRCACA